MKTLLSALLCFWLPVVIHAELVPAGKASPDDYEKLLVKYVTPVGVKYAVWHENQEDIKRLGAVVDFFATTLPPISSKADALAWHLNAYNANILKCLLDQYPATNAQDQKERDRFFQESRITVSGQKISLDELEKRHIRLGFKEPRIHFALNCGSKSCPPLQPKPFVGATLEADLDQLTHNFVQEHTPVNATESGTTKVEMSRIFQWYAEDFGGTEEALKFIDKHRGSALPDKAEVKYKDYDWSLNEAK